MNTSNSLKETIPQKFNKILLTRNPWFKKATKGIWILFLCVVLGFPLYVLSVSVNLFGLFGDMPSLKAIENPKNDLSSELISADGISLGRYFRFNRSQVTYDQLSPDLVNTLLLSEDHRFYDHSGLDFRAYMRVIFGVVTFSSSSKGGGSTITQQLAKNLFSTRGEELDGPLMVGPLRILISKTKEWIISVKLEKNFTKEEIITMYLNTSDFSSNAYGIKVAAETYFDKQPSELNVQESAVLVGMLQAPSFYNPKRNPNNALTKRNEVLYKLYSHGYIKSQAQYDSLRKLPIHLDFAVQNQNEGLATYFRTVILNDLMNWCKEHGYDLWESGLKIHTTLDSRMQRYAEEAMAESMKPQQKTFDTHWKGKNPWIDEKWNEIKGFLDSRIKQTETYRNLVARYGEGNDSVKIMLKLKKPMTIFTWNGERDTLFSSMDSLNYYKRFLHAGFMSMDARTGAIKAWVGGINHKYFKYDHVRQGTRQPGSSFKPFVYGTAMETGYNPCLKLQDVSPTFKVPGGTWSPPNAEGDRGTGEWMTMRQAMAKSKNSITAQVLQRVGEVNVVNFAHRVGITSPLDAVPSLCLGVSDVSLYEIVGAYSTFVNAGIHTEPFYITRIEDKNGNVIENFVPKTQQAISEQTAYKMIYMLMGGVQEEGGTSRGLNFNLRTDNEIGGKTGTTNNASDGWYMGITRDLVSGAWVGGDERSIHYKQWDLGQGSKTARPIWEKFMIKVYADQSLEYKKGQFRRPSAKMDITFDCSAYELPDDDSGTAQEDWNPNNE
ncbi:transglycosylase domain-containing protein [Chryseolinea sp. Jin1]|uniref:Transglycosylase domain-containing protein n=1 Tax=Chryseolinea lacunae TaxID=2801331 RepID=A0ABS1KSF2_9BACT|nr:transglycosylase domain-containing protein [Chryseolinea lacunae]